MSPQETIVHTCYDNGLNDPGRFLGSYNSGKQTLQQVLDDIRIHVHGPDETPTAPTLRAALEAAPAPLPDEHPSAFIFRYGEWWGGIRYKAIKATEEPAR